MNRGMLANTKPSEPRSAAALQVFYRAIARERNGFVDVFVNIFGSAFATNDASDTKVSPALKWRLQRFCYYAVAS